MTKNEFIRNRKNISGYEKVEPWNTPTKVLLFLNKIIPGRYKPSFGWIDHKEKIGAYIRDGRLEITDFDRFKTCP